MADGMVNITDDSWDDEVTKSDVPVLVDFWAPWCGPCKMIAPVLEEMAPEYEGRLKIAKYNIDDQNAKAVELGIRGIPALLIFKGGELAETITGAAPKSVITEKVDAVLA